MGSGVERRRFRAALSKFGGHAAPAASDPTLASEGIVSIPTETVPMRILTRRGDFLARRGAVSDARIIIQVARSEEAHATQLSELALILAFWLARGCGGGGPGWLHAGASRTRSNRAYDGPRADDHCGAFERSTAGGQSRG